MMTALVLSLIAVYDLSKKRQRQRMEKERSRKKRIKALAERNKARDRQDSARNVRAPGPAVDVKPTGGHDFSGVGPSSSIKRCFSPVFNCWRLFVQVILWCVSDHHCRMLAKRRRKEGRNKLLYSQSVITISSLRPRALLTLIYQNFALSLVCLMLCSAYSPLCF